MLRRTWVKLAVSATAALRALGVRAFADTPPLSDAHLATLRAAARVVLPTDLGPKGVDAAVDALLRWVRNYTAGADMDHGYGVTRIRATPPSPAAAYAGQLDALERLAQRQGASFATLDAASKVAAVRAALDTAKVDALPARPNGRHVIADLMGFFFRSPEANDLCYGAAIGKDSCRGLPGSDQAPAPLTAGGAKALRQVGLTKAVNRVRGAGL